MDSNETSEENENEELEDDNNLSSSNNNYENINTNINTNNTKEVFIISLRLLKKFKEMHIGDSDNIIINYIYEIGLPMNFTSVKYLSLYLYFHKICSSFYELYLFSRKNFS